MKTLAKITLLAVLFIATFVTGVSAQTTTVDLGNFAHNIVYPTGTYNVGESFTIQIELGTSTQQAEDVVGFDLELELSEYAQLPTSVELTTENSWLNPDVYLNDVSSVDDPTRTLHLEVSRSNNSGVTGYGEIVSVTLVSDMDNATPQMLVDGMTGVLTVEDNIDMKTDLDGAAITSDLKVYPNPATEYINLEGLEPGSEYKLIDLSGSIWMNGTVEAAGVQTLDVNTLPQGFYVLQTPLGSSRVTIL